MKKFLLIVLVIVMATAVGIFVLRDTTIVEAPDDTTTENNGEDTVDDATTQDSVEFMGTVTAVNTEQMAVDGPGLVTFTDQNGTTQTIAIPSMGIRLCAAFENIADIGLIETGMTVAVRGFYNETEKYIVPCEDAADYVRVYETYEDANLEMMFQYRVSPDGYVVIDDPESMLPSYQAGFILFNKAEYEELQASTEPREGPAAMSIQVYANLEQLSPRQWIDEHKMSSNVQMAINGDITDTKVQNQSAVSYTIDGLYPTDIHVVQYSGKMYIFSGSYSSNDAPIRADYNKLLEGVQFI